MSNTKQEGETIPRLDRMFREILETQSYTGKTKKMVARIEHWAHKYGCVTMMDEGNLYCTKGTTDIYPCIVAHTDTVHPLIPDKNYKIMQADEMVFGYNKKTKDFSGIGGDDKVGIYIALTALRDLPSCKAVFFRDEECGCEGSRVAKKEFFDDCGFILQCDRRGNNDFVSAIWHTDLYGKEFHEAIAPTLKGFGYKETDGMMTDVQELKEMDIELCMANMSCGYYNPHCKDEYINLYDVERCRSMVMELCRILRGKQWKHAIEYVPSYYGGYSEGYDMYSDYVPKTNAKQLTGKQGKAWWEEDGLDNVLDWRNQGKLKKPISTLKNVEIFESNHSRMYPSEERCVHCNEQSLWFDSDTNLYFCSECNEYN